MLLIINFDVLKFKESCDYVRRGHAAYNTGTREANRILEEYKSISKI